MAWVTVKLEPPFSGTSASRYFVGEELISGEATEDISVNKIECSYINIANMVRDALNAMEA